MKAAHDLPLAIQWHEGMLLAPQHFQQATRRQEELAYYHAATIAPYHWGVRHLKIDPIRLVDGAFHVLELEAILPDGLVVSHFGDEAGDLAFDLSPFVEEMRERSLTVHLVATAASRGLPEVTGAGARYESLAGPRVADVNTGEGELEIPRLRPRLRLVAGAEVPKKYTSFPLARLRYGGEAFTQTEYVPPTLRVALNSPLGVIAQGVAQRLREKATFLAEQVHSPSLAMRTPQLIETRQQVHNLVAALPHFEAVLYSGTAHPYALYLALCSLVGQAAVLGYGLLPPVLAPYDHNNPRASFEHAARFVSQAIDEGINVFYTGFPFVFEKGTFNLLFDPAWMERTLILGVRSREGISPDTTVAWMEESKVGTESKMPGMRHKRIYGAEHLPLERAPDLVPARGVILFSLAADPEFIVPEEVLQILNLDDPDPRHRPVEIVLYVRNPPPEDEP